MVISELKGERTMTLVQAIKAAARWYAAAQRSEGFRGVSVYRWKNTYKGWDWVIGSVEDRDVDCVCWVYPVSGWRDPETRESVERLMRDFYGVFYRECTSRFKK